MLHSCIHPTTILQVSGKWFMIMEKCCETTNICFRIIVIQNM